MRVDRTDGLALGFCPVCHSALYCSDVKIYTFNCPHCGKALIPDRGPAYFWIRLLFIWGGAFVWAWHSWHESVMVFFLGFYALPLFFIWIGIERMYLPPREFKQPGSPFLTLGI
jgi:hypothetical protein